MNSRDRIQIPTSDPSLSIVVCDDGSKTLRCQQRNVTWHSESGALAESQLVFLRNSGIALRLESGSRARVLEVGFGTGLNFWLTASLAIVHAASLEYVAYEPHPVPDEILQSLEYEKLAACRPAMEQFPHLDGVRLQVFEKRIQDLETSGNFDAIYHDPFSPEAAPELWTRELLSKLFAVLASGGRLVTYCVKSEIQKRAAAAGFVVSKTRGPVGGKREVLIAEKP